MRWYVSNSLTLGGISESRSAPYAARWLFLATCLLLGVLVSCDSSGLPSPTAGTPLGLETYAPSGTCLQAAVLPVVIAHEEGMMVFRSASSPDHLVPLTWPVGYSARLVDGVAELVARNGNVMGRQGDVLDDLGGGPDASGRFAVCSKGSMLLV